MNHGRSGVTAGLVLFCCGLASAAPQKSVPGEFLIKVKSSQALRNTDALRAMNVEAIRVVSKKDKIFLVKKSALEREEYTLDSLRANPNVEIAEPNLIYQMDRIPNDPKLGDLWGLINAGNKGSRAGVDIGAEQAWDIQTGSRNVIVAVVDTGIDYTHPDIKDNVWVNEAEKNGQAGVDDDKNGFVDDIYGYNFADNTPDPMDDNGHGTHVSGTIGAKGNDNKGIVGVNWNVRIMGVKFLDKDGSGTLENAIRAIEYANANGAQIESNSWGGGSYTDLLKGAIEHARDKNILFVAAAGNDGVDNDQSPHYPASYEVANVISVAAIDNTGQLAEFSDWGAKTVHVAAPGVDIISSFPGGYKNASGTSMATPHVSGVAALLKAQEPSFTYAQLKDRIIRSAKPLSSIKDKVSSHGMVNAFYALTNQVSPPDAEDPLNWSGSKAFSFSTAHPYPSKDVQEFKVTVPGAKEMSLYFDRFETEGGYDIIQFQNGSGKVMATWSGKHNAAFSPGVKGDTIIVKFQADDSNNAYGFDISKIVFK